MHSYNEHLHNLTQNPPRLIWTGFFANKIITILFYLLSFGLIMLSIFYVKVLLAVVGFWGNMFCGATIEGTVVFLPMWGNEPLRNEIYYPLSNGKDSLRVENVLFYVSNITFLKNNKAVFKENNSYHLIDFQDTLSQKIRLKKWPDDAEQIHFSLGIDSITNVSGAMGGDLDPMRGMYWTWQSGYINVKIEGQSSVCLTRHNRFQFHLGGYTQPFGALQQIDLPLKSNLTTVIIPIDIACFLENIDLAKQNTVMIPSKEALQLSQQLAACINH